VVHPGNAIDLSVHETDGRTDESRIFTFEATSDAQVVLRHGLVEVAST
jgi:hypothetical protein